MKRAQLIQIAVIAVALICGYNFFNGLINTLIAILYQFSSYSKYASTFFIEYLIISIIYLVAAYVLIRKSRWIATFIDGQSNKPVLDVLGTDTLPIKIQLHGLLYIVIAAIAIIAIVKQLPGILVDAYHYFKNEAGSFRGDIETYGKDTDNIRFKTSLVQIIIAGVLLYLAAPISKWLTHSFRPEESVIETTDKAHFD